MCLIIEFVENNPRNTLFSALSEWFCITCSNQMYTCGAHARTCVYKKATHLYRMHAILRLASFSECSCMRRSCLPLQSHLAHSCTELVRVTWWGLHWCYPAPVPTWRLGAARLCLSTTLGMHTPRRPTCWGLLPTWFWCFSYYRNIKILRSVWIRPCFDLRCY